MAEKLEFFVTEVDNGFILNINGAEVATEVYNTASKTLRRVRELLVKASAPDAEEDQAPAE